MMRCSTASCGRTPSRRAIDALARTIAEFHAGADVAAPDSSWGTCEAVWAPVAENFRQLELAGVDTPQVRQLRQWSEAEFQRLQSAFASRKRDGFVRECHGDLHANNLLLIDDQVRMFDCVEFNENFRWVDVLSDLAFACMDLADFGRSDFAHRLRNAYLEITCDYAGLAAWRYYYVYRALVRAKVAAIRGRQAADEREPATAEKDVRNYLSLAARATQPLSPRLFITHGPSGSGKSTLTQPLVEALGMIRVRSDVERQRGSVGLDTEHRYSEESRQRVYDHLERQAESVVGAGLSVIVDATFLARENRARFQRLAERRSVEFVILDFQTPADVLQERVARRRSAGPDASEADVRVLLAQLESAEPLDADERDAAMVIDTTRVAAAAELAQRIAGADATSSRPVNRTE
jgi:predicted kinase